LTFKIGGFGVPVLDWIIDRWSNVASGGGQKPFLIDFDLKISGAFLAFTQGV